MQTQKIFKVGNSTVVTIPKHLLDELSLKPGQLVTVEKSHQADELVVKKPIKQAAKPKRETGLTPEFKAWLDDIAEKESDIIKALAKA